MSTPRNRKPSEPVIRLLIADDHAIVRFGLTTLLQYEDDITVVAEAEDGEAAIRLSGLHRPDVAVIDLAMPGIGGIEAIREISRTVPETRIVVFTSFGTSDDIVQALNAGVAGIVLKDSGNDCLIDAIRRVARGEKVIPPEMMQRKKSASGIVLTDQEREALSAVARGLTNREISTMTGLSKDVTKHLLSDLFAKLGVANRSEAVAIALKERLLDL